MLRQSARQESADVVRRDGCFCKICDYKSSAAMACARKHTAYATAKNASIFTPPDDISDHQQRIAANSHACICNRTKHDEPLFSRFFT